MFLHSFKLINSLFSVPLSYLFKGFVLVSSFFLVLHMKLIITRIVLLLFLQIVLQLLQEKISTFENYSYLLQVSNSGMQISIHPILLFFVWNIMGFRTWIYFFLKGYLLPFQKKYRFLCCSKYLRRYNCFQKMWWIWFIFSQITRSSLTKTCRLQKVECMCLGSITEQFHITP